MAPKKGDAPALPKVKQCNTIGADLFGCIATYSDRLGRWGVMNPGLVNPDALGGHWASDDDVKDWADLTPAAVVEQPKLEEPQGVTK